MNTVICILQTDSKITLAIESPNKKVFTVTSTTRLTKIEIILLQGCSKKFIFPTLITIFCSITNKLQCKIEKKIMNRNSISLQNARSYNELSKLRKYTFCSDTKFCH